MPCLCTGKTFKNFHGMIAKPTAMSEVQRKGESAPSPLLYHIKNVMCWNPEADSELKSLMPGAIHFPTVMMRHFPRVQNHSFSIPFPVNMQMGFAAQHANAVPATVPMTILGQSLSPGTFMIGTSFQFATGAPTTPVVALRHFQF